MPDQVNEIMASLGRLEAGQTHLDARITNLDNRVNEICGFKDVFNRVCQEFKDYKESRKDLPDKINVCERKIESQANDITAQSSEIAAMKPEVEIFRSYRWKAIGIVLFLAACQALVAFVVLLNPILKIKYTLGP